MLVFKVVAAAAAVVLGGKRAAKSVRGESQDVRDERIARFWADPINAVLIPVGKLLGLSDGTGGILADHVARGAAISIPEVTSDGIVLNARHQVISLATIDLLGEWGCVGCGSAHGSGVTPSKGKPKSKGLATNLWYYRPYDGALFVISESCWKTYVSALGQATDARFCDARAYVRTGGKLLSAEAVAVVAAAADAEAAADADAPTAAVADAVAAAVVAEAAAVGVDVATMSDDAILAMADSVVVREAATRKGGKR